ncbi:unnamed protein product [Orchesella dallaii]|uniref:Odorant-binding protein n=1 Tax=Orchesella dallaii TaxID=48710 RepID=A0ABP1PLW7_9HEXA
MTKFSTLVCVLLIAFLKGFSEAETFYPNIACHPGFNDTEVGTRLLEFYAEECQQNAYGEMCYERCVFQLADILEDHLYALSEESSMLEMHFKYDEELRTKLAKRVIADCSAELVASEKLPCEEKTKLWKCFEKALVHLYS